MIDNDDDDIVTITSTIYTNLHLILPQRDPWTIISYN